MEIDKKEEERQRYRELLEEVRTIIPGVQVLFAFLLTSPFATRFSRVDFYGKVIFTVSLISAAAATIIFLAPAAFHRLAARQDRIGRLRFGVRAILIGLFLLILSMSCAVFVVVRFLFDNVILSIILAISTALLAIGLRYIHPMLRRKHGEIRDI